MTTPPPVTIGMEEGLPIGWLHIKIGQIFASLEDVRGTMGEMRDEVIRLRDSQSSIRETVYGVVSKIDTTSRRIAELEEDIEPFAAIGVTIQGIEKDIALIKPRLDRLDSMRLKFVGGILTFTALASGTAVLLEVLRTVLIFHPIVQP